MFDFEGARKEGYSDAEIAEYLASQNNFDMEGARKEGYSDTEVIDYLTNQIAAPVEKTEEPSGFVDNMILGAETTGKGLVRGALDIAQVPASIVDFAARALPEDAEKTVRGYAQKNMNALEAMKPEYDESVKASEWYTPSGLNRSVSEALPSTVASFVPAFAAQKFADVTAKGLNYVDKLMRVKRAGQAAGIGSGIALESGFAHKEFLEYEKQHPDDPNVNAYSDFMATVVGGTMAGSLEGLSSMKLFTNAFGPKEAGKVLGNVYKRAAKGLAEGYAIEGGTEAAQEVIANAFKSLGYKPDQSLVEGAFQAFVVGGLVGGPMNAVSSAVDTQAKQDARKAVALTRIENDLASGAMTNDQLQKYAEQGNLDDFNITGDEIQRLLMGDTEQTVDEVLQEMDIRKGAILGDLSEDLGSGAKTVDDVLGYLGSAELHEFGVTDDDLYSLIGDEYRPGVMENMQKNQTMEDLLNEYDPSAPAKDTSFQDGLRRNRQEVEEAAFDRYSPDAPVMDGEEMLRRSNASSPYSAETAAANKQGRETLMLPPGDTMTRNLGVMITPFDPEVAAQRKRQRDLLQLPETTEANWEGILIPEEQRIREYSPQHAADLKRSRETLALPETTNPDWPGVLIPEEQRIREYSPEHAAELKQARDTKALPMPTREGILIPEEQRIREYSPQHAAELKKARDTKALPENTNPNWEGVLVPEEQRVREYSPEHAAELKQAKATKALPEPPRDFTITGRGQAEIQTEIDKIQSVPLKDRTKEDRTKLSALYKERRNLQNKVEVAKESAAPVVEESTVKSEEVKKQSLDEAAHEAATSKKNDLPEPTQAQIEAGNYKKGHTSTYGLGISIENPVGSVRKGVDAAGKKWKTKMADHYGYIKGTVGKDKDHLDVFIPAKFAEGKNDKVAVVDQIDPATGKFDEHKIIFGSKSKKAALTTYLRNYDKSGRKNVGALTMMTVEEFKAWVKNGNTKKPVGELKAKTPVKKTAPAPVKAPTPAPVEKAQEKNVISQAMTNFALATTPEEYAEVAGQYDEKTLKEIKEYIGWDDGAFSEVLNAVDSALEIRQSKEYDYSKHSVARTNEGTIIPVMEELKDEGETSDVGRDARILEKAMSRNGSVHGGDRVQSEGVASEESKSGRNGRDGSVQGKGASRFAIVRVSPTLEKNLQTIAGIFGKRVVFFRDRKSSGRDRVGGLVTGANPSTIYVNTNLGRTAPNAILGHEILHMLKKDRPDVYKKFLDACEALIKEDSRASYKEMLSNAWSNPDSAENIESIVDEEILADFTGDLFNDPSFWRQLSTQNESLFKKITSAVVDFLNAILKKFSNRFDSFGAEEFFTDAKAVRSSIINAINEYAATRQEGTFAKVSGATLESDQFKRWFGDSKIVDFDGSPLPVFHGTSKENFLSDEYADWTFDAGKLGDTGSPQAALGHYFTPDRNEAMGYTRATGRVNRFYLKMENPLEINSWELPSFKGLDDARAWAKRRQLDGHDGIYLKDDDHFIVFESANVKSAEKNTGAFDENNADVRYSVSRDNSTKGVSELAETPYSDNEIKELADRIYKRGKKNIGPFKSAMEEALGDDYPAFKDQMIKLYHASRKSAEGKTSAKEDALKQSLLDERLKSKEYRQQLKNVARYKDLIEALKNGQLDIHKKQALLTKHIREKLPAYARGGQVLTQIKDISKFRTAEGREKALMRGLQLVDKMHDKVIAFESVQEINKMLEKNKPSQVKGRPEGKAMPQVYPVLDGIRQVMKMSHKAVQEKSAELMSRVDNEGREFSTETPAHKSGMSRLDKLSELEQYGILQTFGGLVKRAGVDAKNAQAWLERFIKDGKMVYAINEESRLANIKQWRRIVVHEMSGGKGLQGVADENNAKTKKDSFFSKIKDSLSGFDSAHQSFEWLLDKLTNTKSSVLQGSMTEHFGTLVHRATRSYDSGMIHFRDILANKAQSIYGMRGRKLEKILNKNSETVKNTGVFLRPVKLDKEGEPLRDDDNNFIRENPTEIHLSQNKAYKLWQALMDPEVADSLQVHGYNEDTLAELENFMDPRVKEWAEWQLYDFYPEYYKSINEVYKRMFYVDLPFNAFYSPVSRDHGNVKDDDLLSGAKTHFGSVLNGSLMNRTQSNAAIKIQDGDSVLERHIVQMEHFKAWAETMREIRGVFQHRQVKKAIEQYADKSTLRILNRMMDDMARGGVDRANVLEALDHVRARFVKAVIGLNSVVFMKQLTSIPAYAMDIPFNSFAKGLFTFWKHPIQNWKTLNESQMIQNRYKVGFERDLILLNKKRTAAMLSGKTPWDDFIMFMVKLGDKAAIMTGGWSVYNHYYETYRNQYKIVNGRKIPLMTDADARAKALEKFEMATERTQQAGNVKDLAHVQRIGGSFGKLFTMFMTAPNAYYRSVAGGWRNLMKGRGSKADNAKRIVFGHVVLPMIFQLAANGFDWDNEDQLKAVMMGPFSGLIIARDILGGALGALFNGYKAFDPSFAPVFSTVEDIMDAISAVTAGEMFDFMDEAASALGKLTGVPYDPVRRQVKGIADAVNGDTENPVRRSLGYSGSALGEATKRKKKAVEGAPF